MKKNTVFLLLTFITTTVFPITSVHAEIRQELNEDQEHAIYLGGSFYRERYEIVFPGVVQNMPKKGYTGTWIVDGSKVIVSDVADIEGRPEIGSSVELEGEWHGDTFKAYSIHMQKQPDPSLNGLICGTVDEISRRTHPYGIWRVNGRKMKIDRYTEINDEIRLGAEIEAKGRRINGVFTASELKIKQCS